MNKRLLKVVSKKIFTECFCEKFLLQSKVLLFKTLIATVASIAVINGASAERLNYLKTNDNGELINQDSSPRVKDGFILETPDASAVMIDEKTRFQPNQEKLAEEETYNQINQKQKIAQNNYADPTELKLAEQERELLKKLESESPEGPQRARIIDTKEELSNKEPSQGAVGLNENKIETFNDEFDVQPVERTVSEEKYKTLEENNLKLQKELSLSSKKNLDLTKKLDETKRQLMLAETQVERLSKIIETRNTEINSRLGSFATAGSRENDTNSNSRMLQNSELIEKKKAIPERVSKSNETTSEGDSLTDFEKFDESDPTYKVGVPKNTQSNTLTPILTVKVQRAYLRLSPSDESSIVMDLEAGTKVTAEKKQGQWYQVISPNGVRAWIKAEHVGVGNTTLKRSIAPAQQPQSYRPQKSSRERVSELDDPMGGSITEYETGDEDKALELLRRR